MIGARPREMIYDKPPHVVFVAKAKNVIAGMIDVRNDAHICLFFVAKAFQQKGIGRRLLEQAHAECITNNPKFSGMDVNSSMHAEEAYKRLGFVQSKPEQIVSGFRFVPMIKAFK